MRNVFMSLVFALALAGCASTQETNDTIKQVRDYTVIACGYLPTAATIAKIITNSTIVDTAQGIAAQICAAVTTLPLAEGPGKRQAVVKGIVVKGRFVRR